MNGFVQPFLYVMTGIIYSIITLKNKLLKTIYIASQRESYNYRLSKA
jgi:hypothetical protein